MRAAHSKLLAVVVAAAMLISAEAALGDWDSDQPSLFNQLPDLSGWDVSSEWGTGPLANEGYGAANDWTATTNSAVTDIHFWGSWKNDYVGGTGKILLQIFSNDTSDPAFPRPDELLWSRVIDHGEYTGRLYYRSGSNDLGSYDPRGTNTWQANNHHYMYQYSIPVMPNPFIQQAGQTYWLSISMEFVGGEWGWNTSLDVEGNSSVFWDSSNVWGPHSNWWRHPEIEWKWTQLQTPSGWQDPRTPMDLAFVITPEPAMLFLLAIGAAAVLRKRSR